MDIGKLSLSPIVKHKSCKKHKLAVAFASGGPLGPTGQAVVGAPSRTIFWKAWESAGNDSDIPRAKADQMIYCLSESLKEKTRKALKKATCVALIRDERHGRLLIRYRAVDKHLQLETGVLGQMKDHGTGHENLNKATADLVQQALQPLTQSAGQSTGEQKSSQPHLESALQQTQTSAAKSVLARVEMLCVDSASDELLGGETLRHGDANDVSKYEGICPNLKVIIRDMTHAARRCSRKPECADEFLEQINKKLLWDGSITHKIQYSEVWSAAFAKYCEDVDNKVGVRIKNLRAARHRHEAWQKPKARFTLYMDAYIATALHMLAKSSSADRKIALAFFEFLNEEVVIQTAMLADASAEGLAYVRSTDDENCDVSRIHSLLAQYLQRLDVPFLNQGCINMQVHLMSNRSN